MNTKTYAGCLTARFFLCSKSAYTKNLILDGLFSENVTVKVLQFFRLLSFLCITVKSRSKWEKLSLKTLIIPRVRLTIEFGSFFIYATILPFSLTSGIATSTRTVPLGGLYQSLERLLVERLRTSLF